jgi:hypothetical protein
MELIAHRPLTGTNRFGRKYRADPGDVFDVREDVARKLMARGLASARVVEPTPAPEPVPREVDVIFPKRPDTLPERKPNGNLLSPSQWQLTQRLRRKLQAVTETLGGTEELVETKAVSDYENKAVQNYEDKQKRKRRGRPGTPTRCSCGVMCESARAAKRHCK